jgi:hypothetical protein
MFGVIGAGEIDDVLVSFEGLLGLETYLEL